MSTPLVEKLIVFLDVLRCPEVSTTNLTFLSFLNFSLYVFSFLTRRVKRHIANPIKLTFGPVFFENVLKFLLLFLMFFVVFRESLFQELEDDLRAIDQRVNILNNELVDHWVYLRNFVKHFLVCFRFCYEDIR